MRRFFLFLLALFVFVYFICPRFFAPSYPSHQNVAAAMTSCIRDTRFYYTGQMEKVPWYNENRIPYCTSLITADGHIYVRVSVDKLFSIMGYARFPEEWKLRVRGRLRDHARYRLEVMIKERKDYRYLSWLYLDATVSNIENIGYLNLYNPQNDSLYLLLD